MSQNECAIFNQNLHVKDALEDAESLLKFASEAGIAIDDDTRNHVLDARAAFHTGLDEKTVANLLIALTKLSEAVSPVTAESLRACNTRLERRHPHQNFVLIMAGVVILYSTVSFVTNAIAKSIRDDISTANGLAVKLTSEFGPNAATPPSDVHYLQTAGHKELTAELGGQADSSISGLPNGVSRADVIKDLQQYAASIRNIDTHAQELTWYTHLWARLFHRSQIDPFDAIRGNPADLNREFELRLPISNYYDASVERTRTYQKVRCFAQNMVDDVSVYYGAVSSCILPVLYALLGAAAYLLRSFVQQVSARTYVSSPSSESARLLTAAIAGAAVGLFSTFIGDEAVKASPLALAFLVGYAVDVFYAFLENLIQSITKTVVPSNAERKTSRLPMNTAPSGPNA